MQLNKYLKPQKYSKFVLFWWSDVESGGERLGQDALLLIGLECSKKKKGRCMFTLSSTVQRQRHSRISQIKSNESVLNVENNYAFFFKKPECWKCTTVANCSSLLFPYCAVKCPLYNPNSHRRVKVNICLGF